jgi:hypothetical protein
MRKELEQKVIARWPQWFNTEGDVSHTAPRGFLHGEGWFDILWRLCGDLESLVEEFEQESGCQFEILQVKEKFGGLRIYVSGANDAMGQRASKPPKWTRPAPARFVGNREHCGKGSWTKTLCDEHTTIN